jgi:hypothetical protein
MDLILGLNPEVRNQAQLRQYSTTQRRNTLLDDYCSDQWWKLCRRDR